MNEYLNNISNKPIVHYLCSSSALKAVPYGIVWRTVIHANVVTAHTQFVFEPGAEYSRASYRC